MHTRGYALRVLEYSFRFLFVNSVCPVYPVFAVYSLASICQGNDRARFFNAIFLSVCFLNVGIVKCSFESMSRLLGGLCLVLPVL